jgi:hypothetical protein
MGSITAIPNGQPPSATITGTPTNPVLNFTVPIGNTGTAGTAGAAGTNGAAGDNAWGRSLIPFPQPAVNAQRQQYSVRILHSWKLVCLSG